MVYIEKRTDLRHLYFAFQPGYKYILLCTYKHADIILNVWYYIPLYKFIESIPSRTQKITDMKLKAKEMNK